MLNIAIIGGGPAGVMAAVVAAEKSKQPLNITIFDKGQILKTILYTGNGRCNLSNDIKNFKELASNYLRGEKFLYSIFSQFNAAKTIKWFSDHGLKLYTQKDNRVFPVTDDAHTLRVFFLKLLKKYKIKIKENYQIEKIEKVADKFKIYSSDYVLTFDKVVFSTGGNYKNPAVYNLAKNLGHNITELKPSLFALKLKDPNISTLAGISIESANIDSYFDNKKVYSTQGDFIFTHKGVSGPAIFKTTAACAFLNFNHYNSLILKINFLKNKNFDIFNEEILALIRDNPKKNIINLVRQFVPAGVADYLFKKNKLSPDKKAAELSKKERNTIVSMLAGSEFKAVSPVFDSEIVTAGGVDLKQVNAKTMESKICNGLYFCGEVLDIDGLTGGFNLQACWSTGYVAGVSL